MPAIHLDTLAAIRGKHCIWCYCLGCKRHARLDLDGLAGRLGWDAPIVGLNARLRCSRCGCREVETSLVYDLPPVLASVRVGLEETK